MANAEEKVIRHKKLLPTARSIVAVLALLGMWLAIYSMLHAEWTRNNCLTIVTEVGDMRQTCNNQSHTFDGTMRLLALLITGFAAMAVVCLWGVVDIMRMRKNLLVRILESTVCLSVGLLLVGFIYLLFRAATT